MNAPLSTINDELVFDDESNDFVVVFFQSVPRDRKKEIFALLALSLTQPHSYHQHPQPSTTTTKNPAKGIIQIKFDLNHSL